MSRDRTCKYVLNAIDKARSEHPFLLWAYVIMPEHVHLVILPQSDVKLPSILSCIKLSVSRRAIAWLQENSPEFLSKLEDIQPNGNWAYRFWQRRGGYDRNLRSVRDIHEKIAYMHENPVRRGLVEGPGQWKYSSAANWETGQDKPLRIDRDSVPILTSADDSIQSKLWY